jgi:hypothetical protein
VEEVQLLLLLVVVVGVRSRVGLLLPAVQLLELLLVVVVGVRSRVGLLLPAVQLLLLLKLPGPSRGGARGLEIREGP